MPDARDEQIQELSDAIDGLLAQNIAQDRMIKLLFSMMKIASNINVDATLDKYSQPDPDDPISERSLQVIRNMADEIAKDYDARPKLTVIEGGLAED